MRLGGKNVEVDGRLVRIGRLAAEGFEFVEDPEAMLADITGQQDTLTCSVRTIHLIAVSD